MMQLARYFHSWAMRPPRPLNQLSFSSFGVRQRSSQYGRRSTGASQEMFSSLLRHNLRRSYHLTAPSKSTRVASPRSSALGDPATEPSKQPSYELTFTCKPCLVRSTNHAVSKQAYHHGSVLITCPNCKARHVISDHLKIFSDTGFGIEDFLQKNGSLITKGTIDGDMEFWDDGSKKRRKSE